MKRSLNKDSVKEISTTFLFLRRVEFVVNVLIMMTQPSSSVILKSVPILSSRIIPSVCGFASIPRRVDLTKTPPNLFRSRISAHTWQPASCSAFYLTDDSSRSSFVTMTACRSQQQSPSALFMSAGDDDELSESTKTLDSIWNIPGLKKEVQRGILRCHKKIGKTAHRLEKAIQQVAALMSNDNASLDELENCPNIDEVQFELAELQNRLQGLNALELELQSIKKAELVLPEEIASLALSLGVDDQPPNRPPRGASKPKGPRVSISTRLPYRRYYSFNNVEIRVGKKAADNDDLTLLREHRHDNDWWMHASGCPGSHVVIRAAGTKEEQNLSNEVMMDAAALAARQSKCHGSVIKVSLTKCRDIKKPPGAKPGLVMLTGNVKTVSINMKEAEARLKRLDATALVN